MHARNSEGRLTEGEGRRKGEREGREGGRDNRDGGREGEREEEREGGARRLEGSV